MINRTARSEEFKDNNHGRYWWFHQNENNFVPPIFSFLDDNEWSIMQQWYQQTEKLNLIGECNISAISFIQGLIMGNSVRNIVQLGNYVGFSALLIGFMMRKMGYQSSFVAIDNDPQTSAISQFWINKANLNDYVKVFKMDSTDDRLTSMIKKEFSDKSPNFIFINSSYNYSHTLNEISLWYKMLSENGIMIMHNANEFASQYDMSKTGGVFRALKEWSLRSKANYFILNNSIDQDRSYAPGELTYRDLGGLAIVQK